MPNEQTGALIDTGPADWQILQRDADGFGVLELGGRWLRNEAGTVQVRLVSEDTGAPLAAELDWRDVPTTDDGEWSARLAGIPTGGLYRLETRFRQKSVIDAEWAARGDMRHYLGVGDLWVIAGQSNSAGYGRGTYHDPPQLGVHLFRNSEEWALAAHPMNDSTHSRHLCNQDDHNTGHSPYLHFGRILQQTLGTPVGLVQTALGGSPLSRWNPTEPGPSDLFENMIHCIEAVGGRVTGILWYQGESETGTDELARTCAQRFVSAVGAWRERLNAPDLPVLTVQVNRVYNAMDAEADRRWSLVRDAQRRVPSMVDGVAVVPSLDLPLCDLIHTSPAGNLVLGERMARAALGLVYGRSCHHAPSQPVAAQVTGDGRGIVVRFAPVISRINNVDQLAVPFRVEDDAGQVPVGKVVYPKDDTVQLELGRALSGSAVVHGGYGTNPPSMPVDMERNLPILAFHGFPVAPAV